MTSTPISFQTGVGTDLAVRATYSPGMAPAIAWFDARNIADTRGDWCRWSFGDLSTPRPDPRHTPLPAEFSATVDAARDKLEGPVMAWVYDRPGTYTVQLRIDRASGAIECFTVQVVVAADTRTQLYFGPNGSDANPGTDPTRPLLSVAKLQQVMKISSLHVHLQPGWSGTFVGTIPLLKDQVIEATAGAGAKPLVLAPALGPAFSSWNGVTERCLVRGIAFDAPHTPATTAGGYPYANAGGSSAIDLRGNSMAIIDCDFLNLNRGVIIEGNASGNADGALVMGCRQTMPRGIASQVVSAWGATRVVVLFNTMINSVNESPFRVADLGVDGLTVLYNEFAQEIDAAHGRSLAKAASTIRTGNDVLYAFNWIHDGESSLDPLTAAATVTNALAKWNVLTSPAAPAFFTLRPNISRVTLRENLLQRDNGPCIAIDPDPTQKEPMSDIVIQHNTWSGKDATLVHVYGPTPPAASVAPLETTTLIPSFVCDATNVQKT